MKQNIIVRYDNYYFAYTMNFAGLGKPFADVQGKVFVPAEDVKKAFYGEIAAMPETEINGVSYYDQKQLSDICDQVVWKEEEKSLTIYEKLDTETAADMDYFTEQMKLTSPMLLHPHVYEEEPFYQLCGLYATLFVVHCWRMMDIPKVITKDMIPLIDAMKALRESMTPIADPEIRKWYIWEEKMPGEEEASARDWRYATDEPGFRPFIIPYMLPDQSQVKGNLIVISGGGYEWRSNRYEGYEAVHKFNELGYNCFLLQRRVDPYDKIDGAMDLQRSIRYLKYHAEEFKIAQIDRLAVSGYSGGAMCIVDYIAFCCDDAKPSKRYADYPDDAVDEQNADVKAALLIYGTYPVGEDTRQGYQNNKACPPVFMVIGQKDPLGMVQGGLEFYQLMQDKIPLELHIFQNALHGFGVGPSTMMDENGAPCEMVTTNIMVWPELADTFMKIQFGIQEQFVPYGK